MSAKAWREGKRAEDVELPGPYDNVSAAEPLSASDLDEVVTAYRIDASSSSDRLADLDLNSAWQIDTQAGALRAHVESQRSPRGQVIKSKQPASSMEILGSQPSATS